MSSRELKLLEMTRPMRSKMPMAELCHAPGRLGQPIFAQPRRSRSAANALVLLSVRRGHDPQRRRVEIDTISRFCSKLSCS